MVNELTDKERIAVNEIEINQLKADLVEIKDKLDQLLELKAKGMGALGFVSILLGSGVIGILIGLWNMFAPRSHL